MPDDRTSDAAWRALGEHLRAQRARARLSLRQLARLTEVSDSYLSQIERGLFRPSAEVIKRVADALGESASALYAKVGLLDEPDAAAAGDPPDVADAIRRSPRLTEPQKAALLATYHAFVDENRGPGAPPPAPAGRRGSRPRA